MKNRNALITFFSGLTVIVLGFFFDNFLSSIVVGLIGSVISIFGYILLDGEEGELIKGGIKVSFVGLFMILIASILTFFKTFSIILFVLGGIISAFGIYMIIKVCTAVSTNENISATEYSEDKDKDKDKDNDKDINIDKNNITDAKSVADGEKDYNLLPIYQDNNFLCYEYERDICFLSNDDIDEKIGYVIGNGGKQIAFVFEPDNQYDDKAIAIYLEDKKLGYVYRGQTQDMIHSWYDIGWEICAHINKYSEENKTATYRIGFYKPLESLKSKQFKLTKTSKRIDEYSNRRDNLSFCSVGDFLQIEFDFINANAYIVYNRLYNEIGELPKSAISFIEENDPKKIYGILDSVEENESGNLEANITVYLV